MESRWRKVKLAIGINKCVQVPRNIDNSSLPCVTTFSNSFFSSSKHRSSASPTSTSSPRLSRSKSSKGTCAICLNSVKAGQGHAIFTAECSHSFHFQCITSNVKHGNRICPVCRAKWKEVPFQSRSSKVSHEINRVNSSQNDSWTTLTGMFPSPQAGTEPQHDSNNVTEPDIFDDDDEVLVQETPVTDDFNEADYNAIDPMEIRTYPEFSALAKSDSHDHFAVLINLKAPPRSGRSGNNTESSSYLSALNSRAPIDLVTVLDVSGSMSGTKIALLKRAMGFVIENLSSSDRLSVIAFSSTAWRIFPLRRMTEAGKLHALQAVYSLVPSGATNIEEGLRKGAKVFADSRWKNPVGSIILLSDGEDSFINGSRLNLGGDYGSLVPASLHRSSCMGQHIPVHAFGFGVDHDATAMHRISEISGGTFSFIQDEDVIQDAFAQCIGGLLSVVVQELQVEVQCVHPSLQLGAVKAGSYQISRTDNDKMATIKVGELYAEEERDFLVTVNVPVEKCSDEMALLVVRGVYRDPITKAMKGMGVKNEVKIERPDVVVDIDVVESMEVDRQKNRLRAANAMAEARVSAECGDWTDAVVILQSCQQVMSESISGKAGDELYIGLCGELKEMQGRMANEGVYEHYGRAYVLSGLSAHSGQRATTRGDSTDNTSLLNTYRTPSMGDMVSRSQNLNLLKPARSSSTTHPRTI
ncbi:uncharacterized protein LOC106759082 [Vigna radiata var. radiata]|uniref:Uncharacterized protein LOC106759082 n=1 Tax=Vigna radiata var. radiata TaxID=3916 RepID=A0A1S3TUZ9_VIGRR|nr:uncharacterized protein LOC106759082 [Vigna radiata var. radiata]